MTVANEILRQLGGRQFMMMTNAKNLVGSENMIMFSIGAGAKNKINKVRITLTPNDLYTVEFMKFSPSKLELKTINKVENVFCDMLREIFTENTGFYCTLR